MSTKRRSFNELVEQGRAQSVVPTSALLDPTTLVPAPETVDSGLPDEHLGTGDADGGELPSSEIVPPDATEEVVPSEPVGEGTEVGTGPTVVEEASEAAQLVQRETDRETGLDAVLRILPDEHAVLRTGVRRGARPVRDVTYELPSAAYFAINRLKNDLSRAGERRVTVPAVIEAALSCIPSNAEAVLNQLRDYDTASLLRSGPQRRLSARIGEDRYQSLQDLGLDLYEQTGERIPGSEIWTLAIVLLLEKACRWPLD